MTTPTTVTKASGTVIDASDAADEAVTSTRLPTGSGQVGFWRIVLAEWTKFRTVRSSFWTLLIATALSVAFVPIFLPEAIEQMTPAELAAYEPASARDWNHSVPMGQIALAILGVLVAGSEYSTGSIRATLAAVPRRMQVLWAKTVSLTAVLLVAGAVQAAGAFLVGRPILADHSLDVSLTDPSALRGVGLATLSTLGIGLMGLGLGFLIRHTAGAIGAVVALTFGVALFAEVLLAQWDEAIKYLPSAAAWAMLWSNQDLAQLGTGPATAWVFGYVAVLFGWASVVFRRRDTG